MPRAADGAATTSSARRSRRRGAPSARSTASPGSRPARTAAPAARRARRSRSLAQREWRWISGRTGGTASTVMRRSAPASHSTGRRSNDDLQPGEADDSAPGADPDRIDRTRQIDRITDGGTRNRPGLPAFPRIARPAHSGRSDPAPRRWRPRGCRRQSRPRPSWRRRSPERALSCEPAAAAPARIRQKRRAALPARVRRGDRGLIRIPPDHRAGAPLSRRNRGRARRNRGSGHSWGLPATAVPPRRPASPAWRERPHPASIVPGRRRGRRHPIRSPPAASRRRSARRWRLGRSTARAAPCANAATQLVVVDAAIMAAENDRDILPA